MQSFNAIGLYISIVISIIILVLAICFSYTLTALQSKANFTRFVFQKEKTQELEITNENVNIPYNRLAFSQNPFEGEQRYIDFEEKMKTLLNTKKKGCEQLYQDILINCIGTWTKKSEEVCTGWEEKLEEQCLIVSEEID